MSRNMVLRIMEPLLVQGEDQGAWGLKYLLEIPTLLLSSGGTVTSILEPQLGYGQYVLQKFGVPATVWVIK